MTTGTGDAGGAGRGGGGGEGRAAGGELGVLTMQSVLPSGHRRA